MQVEAKLKNYETQEGERIFEVTMRPADLSEGQLLRLAEVFEEEFYDSWFAEELRHVVQRKEDD